ncbi:uncharacterized protein cenpt [Halichoeres trimaculatus]|uniref:uncharacterized protein cenpt n=1 Tax=Halichoeres trimaculatus TaxID=147232 RepID=UPI003D9E986D
MDDTEDLSARVLLKHILTTEPPRTPVARAADRRSTGATRRSSRLENKNAGAQTPQNMLRRSLKHKLRESVTRKSLPAPRIRPVSVILKKTPVQASMLFDDGDTPRHILMNIMRTDPVRSPVVHEKAATEEPQPSSANSSITSKLQSTELSGLDLPDLTIGNAVSTAKGLRRKRPHRSLNVTAFEKRLRGEDGVEGQKEESLNENSLSLSNSSSLSLKTPFVNVHTEKKGLQRRVSNRRKITVEEFGAAVNKRHMGGATSFMQPEQGPSETAYSEGFTLGLSKLSEPDITTDIFNCNTALYAQPDAITSTSITATQDKPTVMASQLQRQMIEEEQEEQNELGKEKSLYTFPHEEAEPQEEECVSESQEKDGGSMVETQAEDAATKSKLEENEPTPASQSVVRRDTAEFEEEVAAHTEEEKEASSQSEDNEDDRVDSELEEDVATGSQSEEEEVQQDSQTEEEEEKSVSESQAEEEEDVVCSQSDEEGEQGVVESHTEGGEGTAESHSEEEEVLSDSKSHKDAAEDEKAVDSQTEEDAPVDSVQASKVLLHLSDDEGDVVDDCHNLEDPAKLGLSDSKPEDEHREELLEEEEEQSSAHLEHISRRTHRSEGGLIVPVAEAEGDLADVTEAKFSGRKSNAHATIDLPNSPVTTEADPDADKENSLHLSEMRQGIEEVGHQSEESPEEAAAQGDEEEEKEEEEEEEDDEEEEEEEETEEVPSKTPAFVRQKRNLFCPDPLASPSVLRNTQPRSGSDEDGLATAKPKQVRKKRTGVARKENSLPKSYLMGIFKHFAKTKVSADVYPVLQDIMDKFFKRMAEDLETFALHARRKTIEFEDVELLLRRQGHVNDKVPVEVLIEKYLRMDQRRLLIPIATSGNVVFPKKRR